jgi:hypothetical protein
LRDALGRATDTEVSGLRGCHYSWTHNTGEEIWHRRIDHAG